MEMKKAGRVREDGQTQTGVNGPDTPLALEVRHRGRPALPGISHNGKDIGKNAHPCEPDTLRISEINTRL